MKKSGLISGKRRRFSDWSSFIHLVTLEFLFSFCCLLEIKHISDIPHNATDAGHHVPLHICWLENNFGPKSVFSCQQKTKYFTIMPILRPDSYGLKKWKWKAVVTEIQFSIIWEFLHMVATEAAKITSTCFFFKASNLGLQCARQVLDHRTTSSSAPLGFVYFQTGSP